MARKPQKPAEITAATGPAPDAHALTRADEAEIEATEAEMAFEAAESIGITKMALFTRSVADKVIVETFLKLKKNKAYRALTIRGDDGKPRRVADLEEFCERYLGRSARRVQELSQQYQLLGGELFEAAERIGFRNQDYRALKALPEDDQAVIKQAIEAEDRDTVLSLMQELAAKHQAEKAALQAEAAEAQETAEARDQVIKAKEAAISKLELRAATAERKKANFTAIEQAGYECGPLHEAVAATVIGLKKIEQEVARLTQDGDDELILEECYTAVLVAARRALAINNAYGLGIEMNALSADLSDDDREALEFRAIGVVRKAA